MIMLSWGLSVMFLTSHPAELPRQTDWNFWNNSNLPPTRPAQQWNSCDLCVPSTAKNSHRTAEPVLQYTHSTAQPAQGQLWGTQLHSLLCPTDSIPASSIIRPSYQHLSFSFSKYFRNKKQLIATKTRKFLWYLTQKKSHHNPGFRH